METMNEEGLPELLLQLQKDDRIAFNLLFDRFADAIHTYVSIRLGCSATADDIVQEVFIKLWNKRKSIQIRTSFRNYLYTIVQNCITDFKRSEKSRKYELSEQMPELPSDHGTGWQQLERSQLYQLWKQAAGRLPEQMRRIYLLKKDEELSVKEIAGELDLSEQTVKNQLHSANQRILSIMKGIRFLFFL